MINDPEFKTSMYFAGIASVFAAPTEIRSGEANAKEIRARRDVPIVQTSALLVRRLHVQGKVITQSFRHFNSTLINYFVVQDTGNVSER